MLNTEELLLKINELELRIKNIENNKFEYQTDLIKSQIEEINYVDNFQYKDKKYSKYFVKLVGNSSYFYLHHDFHLYPPKVENYIVHKIEGNTIKYWHKLQ
jgi:hypothetical protein